MFVRLSAICLFAALASPALAQQPAAAPPSAAYEKCLLSAVATENVYKDSQGIQFRCFGPEAEAWWNTLPGGREVNDPNGVFIARYFDGPGYCAKQTKSSTGQTVASFVCAIDRPPLK